MCCTGVRDVIGTGIQYIGFIASKILANGIAKTCATAMKCKLVSKVGYHSRVHYLSSRKTSVAAIDFARDMRVKYYEDLISLAFLNVFSFALIFNAISEILHLYLL